MYISNRFDLGDEAYFIDEENKPVKAKVKTILMQVTNDPRFDNEPRISYILDYPEGEIAPFDESLLYRSEWELRDAWMKNLIEFV